MVFINHKFLFSINKGRFMQSIDIKKDELFDNKTACFFTKEYHLIAKDLFETISIPADNLAQLKQYIHEAFDSLKNQAGSNPILMGAIPFDTSQPSSLNIYSQHTKSPVCHSDFLKLHPFEVGQKKQIIQYEYFKGLIENALDRFSNKELDKIVLSQVADFELFKYQNINDLVMTLSTQNPLAYSFVVPVNHGRYLFGASPELLISKQGHQIHSNPLAGSRPRNQDPILNQQSIDELQHSVKDLYEHRIVVESILEHLSPWCSQLNYSKQPDILHTPTMLHLSSTFEGTLKDDKKADALSVALSLHPTPAICGSPTQLAKEFILKHEGYDREYYAGLVGWMDAEGNGEWVVTIRCGLLDQKNIRLYAGAGIVEGSDADSEWHETEAKMQTMLNTLSSFLK